MACEARTNIFDHAHFSAHIIVANGINSQRSQWNSTFSFLVASQLTNMSDLGFLAGGGEGAKANTNQVAVKEVNN